MPDLHMRDSAHITDAGLPDTLVPHAAHLERLEACRVRSLKLALDPAEPGAGMQWRFDAASTRLSAQVQSAHVYVPPGRLADQPAELFPHGWHATGTSFGGKRFVYFPEDGALFYRERSEAGYRWVLLAYRPDPAAHEPVLVRELAVGSGPPLRPTVEGHLVISKMGVVYASRRIPGATMGLCWEQLYSSWPLWFQAHHLPAVVGLTAEVEAPGAALARLRPGWTLEVADAAETVMRARSEEFALQDFTAAKIDELTRDAHKHDATRVLAVGTQVTRALADLDALECALQAAPFGSDPAPVQAAVAALAVQIRLSARFAPHTVSVALGDLRPYVEATRDALRAAERADTDARRSQVDRLTTDLHVVMEAALRQFAEQVTAAAQALAGAMEGLTRALTAFATAARFSLPAVLSMVQSAPPAVGASAALESVTAAYDAAFLGALAPIELGSRTPEQRAALLRDELVRRTHALLRVGHLVDRTVPHGSLVACMTGLYALRALAALREQEGGPTYRAGTGPVSAIEADVFAAAGRDRDREFFVALLVVVREALVERAAALRAAPESAFADVGVRRAALLFTHMALRAACALHRRAAHDARDWSVAAWDDFARVARRLWTWGHLEIADAQLADVRAVVATRDLLTQAAVVLAQAGDPAPVAPVSAGSILAASPHAANDDALTAALRDFEAAFAGELRAPVFRAGRQVIYHPEIVPADHDLAEIRLTGLAGEEVGYVGPAPLVHAAARLVHMQAVRATTVTFGPRAELDLPAEWTPPPPSGVVATVANETGEAAWRSAAYQITQAGCDVLRRALKGPLKGFPGLTKRLDAWLATPYGAAALGYLVGMALELRADPRSARLARELRIEGEAAALSGVLDPLRVLLTAHLETVLAVADGLTADMPEPAATPAEPPVAELEAPRATLPDLKPAVGAAAARAGSSDP